MEEAEVKKEEVEEAELQKYMDLEFAESAQRESFGESVWKGYWLARYDEIKEEYRKLVMNKVEFEKAKNEKMIDQLTSLFRSNFKSRKVTVRELRKLGVTVEDKFVTL